MSETKICAGCDTEKPLSEFSPRKRKRHPYSPYCRTCHATHVRDGYAKNRTAILAAKKEFLAANVVSINIRRRSHHAKLDPMKRRAKALAIYGLTVEQYDQMLRHQDGVCAICHMGETRIDYRTGEVHPIPVDHDKITGKIRGLLCNLCNTAIGMLDHDVERMRAAIRYMDAHEAKEPRESEV